MSAAVAIPAATSDTDLVAAIRAGDEFAFEELYRRYHHRVGSFVRGYVRDEGRAEDVTQEAFLSALRRLRATDNDIAFRPWIFEIARNAAIDHYRRTRRAEEVPMDGEGLLVSADRRGLVGGRAPDAEVMVKQDLDDLRGALAELSTTHERILVLRELEGLSYREIAARMELSRAAVESTLFRARRRLEHEYAELSTGRRCVTARAAIARLAEGLGGAREQRRVARHARRCRGCRRAANELGVDLSAPSLRARAAALLPLPGVLLRRRDGDAGSGSLGTAGSAPATWAAAGPAVEATGAAVSKLVALAAAAALVGAGGATLDGKPPLVPASVGDGPQAAAHASKHPTDARSPGDRGKPGLLRSLLDRALKRAPVPPHAAPGAGQSAGAPETPAPAAQPGDGRSLLPGLPLGGGTLERGSAASSDGAGPVGAPVTGGLAAPSANDAQAGALVGVAAAGGLLRTVQAASGASAPQ